MMMWVVVVVEVTCAWASSLLLYLRSLWPLSLLYGPPLQPPSPTTQAHVKNLIRKLKRAREDEEEKESLGPLLDALPRQEDVRSVRDDNDGYDLLQHAVLSDCQDVILRILNRDWGLNDYACSSPLHLAAQLGRCDTLKLILSHKAQPGLRRGLCYPHPHQPVSSRTGYLGLSSQPVYRCSDPALALTPVECAIKQKNIECVQILVESLTDNERTKVCPLWLLQYACKEGAASCIRYFVRRFPECINRFGADGDTPLLTAVPWGEECVKILVDSGADVHLLSQRLRETALHRLYRMNIDGLFTIYDTTRYLLTTGIEQDINGVTVLGETPLHMLVSHVSYAGGNYVDPRGHHLTREQLQADYQSQVLMAIQELLSFNADPLLQNAAGLQPLSRLLHIAVKASHPRHPCDCVQTSQPDRFIVEYRNDYASLTHAMRVLLRHEAPADFKCSAEHTPLSLLVQCFCYDDATLLTAQAADALQAAELLLQHDADVNFTDPSRGMAVTMVASVCRRCFTDHALRAHPDLQMAFARFANDLLRLLLSKGLEPNHRTQRSCPFLQGGMGNALMEFVRLSDQAGSRQEFGALRDWLLTLLQWGADPDLEPYQSDPIICHSQSSIFLKHQSTQPLSLFLHKARQRQTSSPVVEQGVVSGARDLLLLFYNAMEHKALYHCLNSARGMLRFTLHDSRFLSSSGHDSFFTAVCDMVESPRSLKMMARVAVYKALNRQVAVKVDSLPLPWVVKQYLLHFV